MQKKHLTNFQPIHDINKNKQTKNLSEKEQSIYQKPPTDITTNGKRLNTFPFIRNKALTALIHHSAFSLSNQSNETRKTKGIQIGEEIKLPLLTDGMIVYIENPKKSTPQNS